MILMHALLIAVAAAVESLFSLTCQKTMVNLVKLYINWNAYDSFGCSPYIIASTRICANCSTERPRNH